MPMANPFLKDNTFLLIIKRGKGDKSISPGQITYAIRIIFMYEKNHLPWIYRKRDI